MILRRSLAYARDDNDEKRELRNENWAEGRAVETAATNGTKSASADSGPGLERCMGYSRLEWTVACGEAGVS